MKKLAKYFVFCSLLVFCSPDSVLAQPRTSPFEPPEETDTTFVVDDSPGLDTGCSFRSQGPLVFEIEIRRVVGEVNSDGTLVDPNTLIANRVVSPTATLDFPAYDVDYDADVTQYGFYPERDRIKFNGIEVSRQGTSEPFLIGENNTWIMNQFVVPIQIVRFPEKPPLGSLPVPRKNTISVDIDQANIGGGEYWCTAIDWAVLSFEAMPPIILIHGNNSDGNFWEPGFVDCLEAQGIPYDNTINLPTDFIARNSSRLRNAIGPRVAQFGAKKTHIVAHSKGGLDTRDYVARYYNPDEFQVVSFTTLSTPHHGSAGADLIRDTENMNMLLVDIADLTSLENILARILPYDDGTKNLTTSFCESFNNTNISLLPSNIVYQSISADADINNNRTMERNEYMEMIDESQVLQNIDNATVPIVVAGVPISIPVGQAGVDIVMETMYDFLGTVKSTELVTTKILGVPVYQRISKTATSSFQPNDLMVTVNCAKISPFVQIGTLKKNHASVADDTAANIVIQSVKNLQ